MSSFDLYKKKMSVRGSNARERNFNYQLRDFNRFFEEAPNMSDCFINEVPAQLVFQDHSQSNNKDLSDDKYVLAKNSTPIKIGDYIEWRDSEWLVFTEEYKTIPTHQQVKVKRVNQTVRWMNDKGEISNNGKGWGVYSQSQTLYTLGVASTPMISVVDSKRMLYIQNNEQSSTIKMGQRFFVGKRVYKTNFMDDVSRPGLISMLLDEVTVGPYDNVELGIAEYYRMHDGIYTPPEEDDTQELTLTITGERTPKVGSEYTYESEDVDVDEWLFDVDASDLPFEVVHQDSRQLKLKFKDDFRYIGKSIVIFVRGSNGAYNSIKLTVAKKY